MFDFLPGPALRVDCVGALQNDNPVRIRHAGRSKIEIPLEYRTQSPIERPSEIRLLLVLIASSIPNAQYLQVASNNHIALPSHPTFNESVSAELDFLAGSN